MRIMLLVLSFQILFFLSLKVSADLTCEDLFQKSLLARYSSRHMQAIREDIKEDGRRFIILMTKDKQEHEWDQEATLAPHGNPNIPVVVLRNANVFWGFVRETLDAKNRIMTFSQPDVNTLNFLVKKYNKHVPENKKKRLKFLEIKDSILKDIPYLVLNVRNITPIAEAGDVRMHDYDYHALSALIIPENFHQVAAKKTEILVDFYKYLYQQGKLTPGLKDFMTMVLNRRAREIDRTANISIFIYRYLTTGNKMETYLVKQDELKNYVHASLTPERYLIAELRYTLREMAADFDSRDLSAYLNDFLNNSSKPEYTEVPNIPTSRAEQADIVFQSYLDFIKQTEQIPQ